jgi:hypothetical protein
MPRPTANEIFYGIKRRHSEAVFGYDRRLFRFLEGRRVMERFWLGLRGPRGAQNMSVLAAITQNLRRLAALVARPRPADALCIAGGKLPPKCLTFLENRLIECKLLTLLQLTIPAGLEPAICGAEIPYSSRFLVFIEKPKVTFVRPATD